MKYTLWSFIIITREWSWLFVDQTNNINRIKNKKIFRKLFIGARFANHFGCGCYINFVQRMGTIVVVFMIVIKCIQAYGQHWITIDVDYTAYELFYLRWYFINVLRYDNNHKTTNLNIGSLSCHSLAKLLTTIWTSLDASAFQAKWQAVFGFSQSWF